MSQKSTKTSFQPVLEIRPYTPMQLCQLYAISRKTFLKWIKPFQQDIGERQGHYYTANQVRTIVEKIGFPGVLMPEWE